MDSTTCNVFLVGSGPGATDLITVKGRRCLREAQVVLYDELTNRDLLELEAPDAEHIYVGKRQGKKTMEQQAICDLLVDLARRGMRVVRLKGGDPFVYGRGGEEALALAEAGIPFEVVPGVTAAVAVPAYAGIPMTHRSLADGFEVLTGHSGNPIGDKTCVVLMGMKRLAENVSLLKQQGYAGDLPAAVIQWGTFPRQRKVVATLDSIVEVSRDLQSPAVLVVGRTVGLQERLSWFEAKPLFGKRVLVTRARHQAGETCRLLEDLGAETITMPTIALRPPDDREPLRRAVQQLERYDLLVLTSANALEPLRTAMEEAGRDSRALAGLCVCAIGPGTAKALSRMGIRADLVPRDHRAEGLLEHLDESRVSGKRILLPRAADARQILPETLVQRGAEVDLIPVYETVLPDPEATRRGMERLDGGEVDVFTFTSASTARNFAAIVGDRLEQLTRGKVVAAIGPITRDACEELGLVVHVMPQTYTLPAMVQALVEHYHKDNV